MQPRRSSRISSNVAQRNPEDSKVQWTSPPAKQRKAEAHDVSSSKKKRTREPSAARSGAAPSHTPRLKRQAAKDQDSHRQRQHQPQAVVESGEEGVLFLLLNKTWQVHRASPTFTAPFAAHSALQARLIKRFLESCEDLADKIGGAPQVEVKSWVQQQQGHPPAPSIHISVFAQDKVAAAQDKPVAVVHLFAGWQELRGKAAEHCNDFRACDALLPATASQVGSGDTDLGDVLFVLTTGLTAVCHRTLQYLERELDLFVSTAAISPDQFPQIIAQWLPLASTSSFPVELEYASPPFASPALKRLTLSVPAETVVQAARATQHNPEQVLSVIEGLAEEGGGISLSKLNLCAVKTGVASIDSEGRVRLFSAEQLGTALRAVAVAVRGISQL